MARIVIAVDPPHAARLSDELVLEDADVIGIVAATRPAARGLLSDAFDALVLAADRATLTPGLVAECDRRGIRIVALCDDAAGRRLAEGFGIASILPTSVEGWAIVEALAAPARASRPAAETPAGRVVTVWGPHGAPGRTTLAIELAAELSRGGGRVALADADAHAPSVAMSLGLADEGPGFAAACRQAGLGGLDAPELTRISIPMTLAGGAVDVLTGINRPGRWPELSEERVGAVLSAARSWAEHTVVDVAASLERDEEIVSDLDGPRRNGATLAALRSADLIVAVCAGDPVGVARFVRAYAELRATVGTTRIAVVVNRLRPATLGIDARGQVRRTIERFAGVEDVWFVPADPRATDAATLAARAVVDVAPRSALAAGVRRFVGEVVVPVAAPAVRERARRRTREVAHRVARTA